MPHRSTIPCTLLPFLFGFFATSIRVMQLIVALLCIPVFSCVAIVHQSLNTVTPSSVRCSIQHVSIINFVCTLCCPVNKSQTKSFQYVVNCCFGKMLNARSKEDIEFCMQMFNCPKVDLKARLYRHNSTQLDVELSCVAINGPGPLQWLSI